MRAQRVSEEDRAAALTPPIHPTMPWRIASVSFLGGRTLSVRFRDGLSGTVDMSALIASPDAGVFVALRDDAVFAAVDVVHGAVTWPGDLDLAPDAMYRAIAECGHWTPR